MVGGVVPFASGTAGVKRTVLLLGSGARTAGVCPERRLPFVTCRPLFSSKWGWSALRAR